MKITLAGFVLADSAARLPPLNMTLNGVRVVELADFARAAAKGVFTRGNAATTFAFSVSKVFDSYPDAEDAFFLAESAAPVSGALLIQQTGNDGRPPLGATTAALESIAPTKEGVRVDFLYTIKAGRIVGGNSLPYLFDNAAASTMLAAVPIPASQNFVVVNFPALIASPIVGGLSIVAPQGADSPGVWKVEQLTPAGFVCFFTGNIPAAGFSLHYIAKPGA